MEYVFKDTEIDITAFEDRMVKFAFGHQGRKKTDSLHLGIVEFKPGKQPNAHTHEVEEALYILSGNGKIKIEGQCFNIQKGDFAYIPAGKSHLVLTGEQDPLKILFMFGGKTVIDY